jgi:hypothetical protein
MSSGGISRAFAIRRSPLGQGLRKALAKVEAASPASRDTADRFVPFFFNKAIISAGWISFLFIGSPYNGQAALLSVELSG